MKIMKTRYMLTAAWMLASVAVDAQDLNKEITIDREIVPAQRAASRPVVFPSVTPPTVSAVKLRVNDSGTLVGITPGITPYEPTEGEGVFLATPYRGYADLGYFPGINIGMSAGYAIIDKENTALSVWAQADNRDYEGKKGSLWEASKWKTFDITGGLKFSQKFGNNKLDISTDLAYSSWSSPAQWVFNNEPIKNGILRDDVEKNLSNLRWHLNAGFSGRSNNGLSYGIGAGVGVLNNSKPRVTWVGELPDFVARPISEISANFNGYIRQQISGNAAAGIKVEGEFLNYSKFQSLELIASDIKGEQLANPGSKTIGQVDFIPSYDYNSGNFYSKVGARFGLSVNSGNSFHVAPDVLFGVNQGAMFGAWLKLGGGVVTNSIESVFQRSRYADTRMAYDLSNVAFSGQLGLRFGPFKGASLTVSADYAAANNWLMPYQVSNGVCNYNFFAPAKIRSWKLDAKFDWEYRSLLAVALSYEYNPGDDDDHAWLYWDDRARQVFGASISVTPIAKLTVDLGFTARLERQQWWESVESAEYINNGQYYIQDYIQGKSDNGSYSLGDQTNLWAGASWRFTQAFTAFARFDNILGKCAAMPFNLPSQGFTGLFGIGYKF